jgi:hypothetical protein
MQITGQNTDAYILTFDNNIIDGGGYYDSNFGFSVRRFKY